MGQSISTREASALSLRTVWRARPVRLIIGLGLLLVVAIATAGSFAIANPRNNMLADSERELRFRSRMNRRSVDAAWIGAVLLRGSARCAEHLKMTDVEVRLSPELPSVAFE
jgi:hypothetical protein